MIFVSLIVTSIMFFKRKSLTCFDIYDRGSFKDGVTGTIFTLFCPCCACFICASSPLLKRAGICFGYSMVFMGVGLAVIILTYPALQTVTASASETTVILVVIFGGGLLVLSIFFCFSFFLCIREDLPSLPTVNCSCPRIHCPTIHCTCPRFRLPKIRAPRFNVPSLSVPSISLNRSTVRGSTEENKRRVSKVEVMDQQIQLIDPILKTRIVIPVRGIQCTHLQCFDKDIFMRNLSTKCPVCEKPINGESELTIDNWFKKILKATSNELLSVTVDKSGHIVELDLPDYEEDVL